MNIKMVSVKGGTFMMDSKKNSAHEVTVSDFEIGKYLVTQELWIEIMNRNHAFFEGENLPVERVSWNDVQDFLKKLNEKFSDMNYRLPTRAEWEYAACGGQEGIKDDFDYAGGNNLDELGWYFMNSDEKTHPIGLLKPNQLELYDMSGNVWEWCKDWYGNYPTDNQTNPTGPDSGFFKVICGGGWSSQAWGCRVSDCLYYPPDDRYNNLGFRLARTI